VLSQEVEVNIGNEDHREVEMTVDNKNANLVNMDSVNKDNPEQVPTSQVGGVINMNAVYGDMDVTNNKEDGNVVNEDNPGQVLPKRVVEVNIVNEDHGDVDVIDSDSYSDVILIGSDSDSNGDSEYDGDHREVDEIVIDPDSDSDVDPEYDEDASELLRAHECEVLDNLDELPFCVSQKGERGDMYEKPEKRDVVDNVNPKGRHDNEKTAECLRSPRRGMTLTPTSTSTSTLTPSTMRMWWRLWRCRCTRGLRRGTVSAAPASHTTLDSPLLKQRLSYGMLSFQFQTNWCNL
jgi:hypothetical protein